MERRGGGEGEGEGEDWREGRTGILRLVLWFGESLRGSSSWMMSGLVEGRVRGVAALRIR